jgi:hypothetical protein
MLHPTKITMDFQICRNLHLYQFYHIHSPSTSTPKKMIHRLYLHGLQGTWVCDGFQCGHHFRLRAIAVEHGCPIGQLPSAAGVDGDPKGHRSGWQLQGPQRQGIGRGGTATVQLLTAGYVAQGWTHLGIDSDRLDGIGDGWYMLIWWGGIWEGARDLEVLRKV